jgi:hypothetical protein
MRMLLSNQAGFTPLDAVQIKRTRRVFVFLTAVPDLCTGVHISENHMAA